MFSDNNKKNQCGSGMLDLMLVQNYHDLDPISFTKLNSLRCLYEYIHPETSRIYVYDAWSWLHYLVVNLQMNVKHRRTSNLVHPIFKFTLSATQNYECYKVCKQDYEKYGNTFSEHDSSIDKAYLMKCCESTKIHKEKVVSDNKLIGMYLACESPLRYLDINHFEVYPEASQGIKCTAQIHVRIVSAIAGEKDTYKTLYV